MNDGNHLSAHEGSLCLFSGSCKLYSVCAQSLPFPTKTILNLCSCCSCSGPSTQLLISVVPWAFSTVEKAHGSPQQQKRLTPVHGLGQCRAAVSVLGFRSPWCFQPVGRPGRAFQRFILCCEVQLRGLPPQAPRSQRLPRRTRVCETAFWGRTAHAPLSATHGVQPRDRPAGVDGCGI